MAHSGRKAGAELAGLLSKNKISNLSLEAGDATFHVAEGLALAAYRYTRLLGKKAKEAWTLDSVEVVGLSAGDAKRLEVLMAAVTEARDLINTPVLDLTAEDLAARAEELGQIYGFKVTVLNQAKIESLKMGGLLGVNKGSVDPATFSILEYKPEKAVNSAPYVLVGKGVVYDTGGLSLKPSNFMDTMKCDMSGAAAVIGTLWAAARAIGPNATVAMGNASREVWEQLQTSAANTHERLVEFPFWDEYNDLLKSEIADLKNIGGAEAGAITAGKFLEHFTDYPYVHLDIAGPAFLDSPWGYYGKGGTGVGVRLLTDCAVWRSSTSFAHPKSWPTTANPCKWGIFRIPKWPPATPFLQAELDSLTHGTGRFRLILDN